MIDKDEIKKKVTEIILNESPGAQIEDDEDYRAVFSDIGVDSLDLMMAMMKVSEIYGVEIKDEHFSQLGNIQDIVDFVDRHRQMAD